jgi:hypothetical protein
MRSKSPALRQRQALGDLGEGRLVVGVERQQRLLMAGVEELFLPRPVPLARPDTSRGGGEQQRLAGDVLRVGVVVKVEAHGPSADATARRRAVRWAPSTPPPADLCSKQCSFRALFRAHMQRSFRAFIRAPTQRSFRALIRAPLQCPFRAPFRALRRALR